MSHIYIASLEEWGGEVLRQQSGVKAELIEVKKCMILHFTQKRLQQNLCISKDLLKPTFLY